jgi:cytochrome c biogenesis protein CcmG, thiol:disulfide interchange protein DsbE
MKWRRAILLTVGFGTPMMALLAFGLTRDPGEIFSPLPGRAAPEFVLPTFTSGVRTVLHPDEPPQVDTVRLSDLRGDVVVVNFWASWCLACRTEHEALHRVAARYAGGDVHFVGVLYNDSPSNGLRWLRTYGELPYPSVQDNGARTAIDYGLYGVPETFFIGRDGRVAYKHAGPVSEQLLISQIEALRAMPRDTAATDAAASTGVMP